MKVLIAAAAIFAATATVVPTAVAQTMVERVTAVVSAAREEGVEFDGEIAVGDASGVLADVAFGTADRTRGPHRAGETWRYASVTKQITATLVMMQVDRGRIALDDTVSKHLPGFAGASAGRVTIRQLLQHTSGLPNPDDSEEGGAGVPSFYTRPGQRAGGDAAALAYCAGPPKAEPGARFEYNNCDSIVIGEILRRLTGRSYERLVREQIAAPLKLRSLRYGQPTPDIVGYDGRGRIEAPRNIATYGAGGALSGTAQDLLAFDRALVGGALLSSRARDVMWTGDPSLGYVALGAWSFSSGLAGCTGDVELVERRGAIGGIQVRNLIAPKLGRAVVVFTNNSDFLFGEIWRQAGFMHELASAAFCER